MLRNPFAKRGNRIVNSIRPEQKPDCQQIQARLFACLDNELDAAQQSALERHLGECAACRQEWETCRRAESALVSALTAVPAPGDLRAGFYEKLERTRQSRPAGAVWRLAIPALAAPALAAGLLFLMFHPLAPGKPKPGSSDLGAGPQSISLPPPVLAAGQPRTDRTMSRTSVGQQNPARNRSLGPSARIIPESQGPAETHARRQYPRGLAQNQQRRTHRPGILLAGLINGRRAQGSVLNLDVRLRGVPASVASAKDPRALLPPGINADAGARTFGYSDGTFPLAARDKATALEAHRGVALAALVDRAEVHVSDDNRDFMSSTHVDTAPPGAGRTGTVNVDDDNETAEQPVELPALP